jgi:hypothetical protein
MFVCKIYNNGYECGNKIIGLDSLVFHHREDFYNYMRLLEGFTIPELEPNYKKRPEEQKQNDFQTDSKQKVTREQQKIIKEPTQQERNLKENKKKARKKLENSRAYYTLTLLIANQELVWNPPQQNYLLKFDLMASSDNSNIYFDGATARIEYDTTIFGSFVRNKWKASVWFGEQFNNNLDYLLHQFIDLSANSISVAAYPNIAHPNRVKLNNTPIPFLHFQIEVFPDLISKQSQLNFIETIYCASMCFYTQTSNAPMFQRYPYDEVFFMNPPSTTLSTPATPVITNFNPAFNIAGVGEILTINGIRFGAYRGEVLFKVADDGGQSYLNGLDEQYVNSWSDTLIKVRVPSLVYKGYTGGASSGGAGSGTIKIKTEKGRTCESSTPLHIPYSVMNGKNSYLNTKIHRVYLAKKYCEYDYMFTLHSEYDNPVHEDKIRVIEIALRHWSALTGLTLILEKNTTGLIFTNLINDVNKNIIQFTTHDYAYVDNAIAGWIFPNDTLLFRPTGSHIYIPRITSGFSWTYDTIGYVNTGLLSFYQVFMHELGHILQLGHVNDDSQIMYYLQRSLYNIINLISSDTAVLAVEENIKASKSQDWRSSTTYIYPIGSKKPKITIINHNSSLICNDSIVTLTSNFPTGNLWSTGATTQTIQVDSSGKYWLKFTDDVCVFSADTVSLTFSTLTASFNVCNVVCHGTNTGSIVTSVQGTHSPFFCQWTGNDFNTTTSNPDNLYAGTYHLELTNSAGCTTNYNISVTQPDALNAYFSPQQKLPDTFLAWVTGGTPPYSYQWTYTPSSTLCRLIIPVEESNLPYISVSYQTSTCFLQLTITDACGSQVILYPPTGKRTPVNEFFKEIVLYPNPTSATFSISGINNASVFIYSVLSEHIKTFKNISSNETIKVGDLLSGIYIVKIVDGDIIKNEKLILSK